ncbi:MAG: 4Fe-4S dicluster domain-containing protein [Candidatus Lokiarchaeota archaeon]|nr:4Fe-4S dicluster domain-containing protein [Candidatus Lokiarchaeota archaeon]
MIYMVKEIELTENEIIDLKDLDLNFKDKLIELPDIDIKSLKYCFQCSTCTASCPVAHVMDLMPHQVMRMISLGMEEKVLQCNTIWLCTTCYNCQDRCPQSVKVTDILFALKNLASRLGEYPASLKNFAKTIYELGRSIEVTDFEEDDREYLKLPKLEPFDSVGIKKIFEKTGLLKKLNNDIEAEE